MNPPETRYAKAPDGTSIAYQVIGAGSVDLVYASGIFSNVDLMWDQPACAHFLDRLASFPGWSFSTCGASDCRTEAPSRPRSSSSATISPR